MTGSGDENVGEMRIDIARSPRFVPLVRSPHKVCPLGEISSQGLCLCNANLFRSLR